MFKTKSTNKWVARSFKYILPYLPSKNMLDIGCGYGVYLSQFGPGSKGVEVDSKKVKYCIKNNLDVIEHDINKGLPFENESFEGVLISHVLEHVQSPYVLLKEIDRVLVKKGRLVIALPPRYSLPRLFGVDDYYKDHDHLYEFSLLNVKLLLEKTGFSFVKLYVEPILIQRMNLNSLIDIFQMLPVDISIFLSNAFWVVSRKQ